MLSVILLLIVPEPAAVGTHELLPSTFTPTQPDKPLNVVLTDPRSTKGYRRQLRRLLRVRGERPGEWRAAERGYEFSPSNVDCHLPLQREVARNKRNRSTYPDGRSV
jgi:hypothetical protein